MTIDKNHPMFGIKIAEPYEVGMGIQMGTNFDLPKPLVIYHANCADGFSAAWCFWNLSNKNFDFHPGVYSEAPPDVTDRVVYLVDFSYKREVVNMMCGKAKHVYLIDHHKTAIDDCGFLIDEGSDEYQKNFTWYVDLERSGAMLAWDFLHNVDWYANDEGLARDIAKEHKPGDINYVTPPLLLGHVQDRDLWKFKLEGSKPIHLAMSARNWTFEEFDNMMLKQHPTVLHSEGLAIERKHFKDLEGMLDMCEREMGILIYSVVAANLPGWMASDGGNRILQRNPHTPFAASYYDTSTQRIFSLRSEDSRVDVSEIAKLYGGGGHRNAAGFRVSRDHILARS